MYSFADFTLWLFMEDVGPSVSSSVRAPGPLPWGLGAPAPGGLAEGHWQSAAHGQHGGSLSEGVRDVAGGAARVSQLTGRWVPRPVRKPRLLVNTVLCVRVPEPDLLMPRAGSRRRGEPVILERHAHEHKPWGFTGLTVGRSPKPRPSCDEAIPHFQETMNEGFAQHTGRDVVIAMLPTLRVRTGSLKPVLLREYVSASVQLCLEMHVSDEKSQYWKECVHVRITKDLLWPGNAVGSAGDPELRLRPLGIGTHLVGR